jgi:ketosteroid isomerase-like protein
MKGAHVKTRAKILVTKIIVSLLFIGIAVFWSLQAFGAEFSEAQKEIWNLEIKYWESIKNADVETIKNLLHDNIVSMHSRRSDPDNKHQQILQFRYWLSKDKPKSYEIEPLAIQLFNNVAIACFYYKFAGKDFSDSGRVTHTWMKQNDTWYLIGLMEASYESLPMHY